MTAESGYFPSKIGLWESISTWSNIRDVDVQLQALEVNKALKFYVSRVHFSPRNFVGANLSPVHQNTYLLREDPVTIPYSL